MGLQRPLLSASDRRSVIVLALIAIGLIIGIVLFPDGEKSKWGGGGITLIA